MAAFPSLPDRRLSRHSVRSETNGISKSSRNLLNIHLPFCGAGHVCIGTDAPFDMADNDPKATIDAVPGITPLERKCLCCGTALKLLREG